MIVITTTPTAYGVDLIAILTDRKQQTLVNFLKLIKDDAIRYSISKSLFQQIFLDIHGYEKFAMPSTL